MQYAVIAAGQGSRLAPAGSVPKPLVPVGGRPLLGRLLDAFAACGAREAVVVANPDCSALVSYLDSDDLPLKVNMVLRRSATPLESVEATLRALNPGKFILATTDTVFDPRRFALYAAAYEAMPDNAALMAVTRHDDDEKPLYVNTDCDGRITGFGDTAGERSYVSAGIYAMHTTQAQAALRLALAEGATRLRDFQRALLRTSTDMTIYDIGTAIDVDRPSDLAAARNIFERQ